MWLECEREREVMSRWFEIHNSRELTLDGKKKPNTMKRNKIKTDAMCPRLSARTSAARWRRATVRSTAGASLPLWPHQRTTTKASPSLPPVMPLPLPLALPGCQATSPASTRSAPRTRPASAGGSDSGDSAVGVEVMAPACRFFFFFSFSFSFFFENKSLQGRQGSVDGIRMWSFGV
jgi:hypothetical protein